MRMAFLSRGQPVRDDSAYPQRLQLAEDHKGNHQRSVSTSFSHEWTGSYGQKIH